ncbi:cupin domain-containing protein [Aquimarina sp. D1M17]|uniref:cupin domain-containing protein n=1 Tax=Aquimarina acroporae TaxID=2937283 RepID=UPI0020C05601|nr:cupin domain-containing protein [Aquimarina acroporae]MCK8523407.1 cupin domain-containing protein [Aquimarina acroporae]
MKSFGSSDVFIKGNEVTWETVGEGVKRQIMGYDDKIMLVHVKFKKGSEGPIHDHHHSQVTYVQSGEFEVSINGEKKILKGGDCFYIPPHAPHGAICLEDGVLIDVFSPIREDFM